MSTNEPQTKSPPVAVASTPPKKVVEDKDEVIVDEKTGESIVIPSDVSSTGMTYDNGEPVPDRIVTILLNEYGDYPEEFGTGFMKEGTLKVMPNVGPNKDLTMEIQTYVRKDPDGKIIPGKDGKPQITEIRKSITKEQYPVVKKIREMIAKEKDKNKQKT